MAYGRYGYNTDNYGHGSVNRAEPEPAPASLPSHAKLLRDALERVIRGSMKDDPPTRAIEDGPVIGSATAQD
ncbi:MAG TPA: hypothetical protein PLQ87_02550 [Phycisphaerae bacterium]|nr:hypothetical protein [Phycisphaerae bacterium]